MSTKPEEAISSEEAKAAGHILVCGPYRPEEEDWMLRRAVRDMERGGLEVIRVWKRARADQGGYIGIALYRRNGR